MKNYNIERARNYYDNKFDSYAEKYSNGIFTHLHTGIYYPQETPYLFKDLDFSKLGLNYLKDKMTYGQERLAYKVRRRLDKNNETSISDVGCGHCGSALFMAYFFGDKICAVTVSDRERSYCFEKIIESSLESKISIIESDLLSIPNGQRVYEHAIAIESLNSMGNHIDILSKISSLIKPNGRLVI